MKTINTNENLIDDILSRSISDILPSRKELKAKLQSWERLRIYIGADATWTALHLWHATNFILLEKLRQLGHETIILIWDFTARIGDPTDKTATRVKLTRKQVIDNTVTWLKQIGAVVDIQNKDNPVSIVHNHDRLSKLSFEDIIELSSHFTVQQMLERSMFKWRMNSQQPIHMHEFFYPLMQWFDSVELDVDIELCGNDQLFNAMAWRTLMKKIKSKEKFVVTTTLLENPKTWEKMMSKSLGTGIFLDEDHISMFWKVMAQPDENIPQLFTDCTLVSVEKINEILLSNSNPRDSKLILAWEITNLFHWRELADSAKNNFEQVVQNKEIPVEIDEIIVSKDSINIVEALILAKFAKSNGEAKRLIIQNWVKIDGSTIASINEQISLNKEWVVVQKWKINFVKIKN